MMNESIVRVQRARRPCNADLHRSAQILEVRHIRLTSWSFLRAAPPAAVFEHLDA